MPFAPPIHRGVPQPPPKKTDPFYQSPEWKALRQLVLARDRHRCIWPDCTTPGRGYGQRLIVDHIQPRREGGADVPANLRTLCPACDNRRHGRKG
jgi:5-methylcytosine-specific restriction endonuclease McrA